MVGQGAARQIRQVLDAGMQGGPGGMPGGAWPGRTRAGLRSGREEAMPRLKGGIVLVDYNTGAVQRLIPLQYNPETLTRTLQVQGVGPESGPHVDQMRLKGPPIETFKLEADLDASDQLDAGDPLTTASGIQPQLAALETVIYPTSTQLQQANAMAQAGTLEIVPMDAPLTLFVWSKERVVPVKHHRVQHHRGDVRFQPEPDPGQGQPGPAGAHDRRR